MLSTFNGMSSVGNWVLRVCDGANGDTGTINRVLLGFTGTPSVVVRDYGDAPASYGDAEHIIDSSLYLGDTVPDAESGSQHSYNAYGDGQEITDGAGTWYMSGDEDGAPRQPVSDYIPLFPVLKMTATTYSA